MRLGENAETDRTILEQKDLSDLTPEAQRWEAQQFIVNMQEFMIKRIQELDENPEEKAEFVRTMDKLEQRFIENHQRINSLTFQVWEELKQKVNIESLPKKQIHKFLTPERQEQLHERAKKREELTRIRENIKDYLDEEGLKRFNEVMEDEINLIG